MQRLPFRDYSRETIADSAHCAGPHPILVGVCLWLPEGERHRTCQRILPVFLMRIIIRIY